MMSNHIEFPCFEVQQGSSTRLYLGSMRFATLQPLITVSPREPRTDDPYFANTPDIKAQYPQRPERKDRLREIANFVEQRLTEDTDSRKQVIFPTTVILGLLTDCEVHEQRPEQPTPTAAHLLDDRENEHKLVLLPSKEATLFIIDGQHRLKGLGYLYENLQDELTRNSTSVSQEGQVAKQQLLEKIKAFEVPISLLLDFDLDEQAMVFADVNFNQKPVPRSFYYDIFGAFESDKVTPISFIHEFVVHLNTGNASPLQVMIKLLGSGPGFVSQAFMVQRLVPLVDPQTPKSVFQTFFLLRDKGEVAASRQFAKIVEGFFSAVKDEFNYAWPRKNAEGEYKQREYEFILVKSMVTSGLLGILREIYKLSLLDFASGKEPKVASENAYSRPFFSELLQKIDPEGRKDPSQSIFSRDSQWAVGGSSKVERIIFESLRTSVFNAYKEIVDNHKSEYSQLCARFPGERRAIKLLQSKDYKDERDFWEKTERMWEKPQI